MKQITMPDVLVEDSGTVFLIKPLTDPARNWLKQNAQHEAWQWFGDSLAVDHRFVEIILRGMKRAGLEAQHD